MILVGEPLPKHSITSANALGSNLRKNNQNTMISGNTETDDYPTNISGNGLVAQNITGGFLQNSGHNLSDMSH